MRVLIADDDRDIAGLLTMFVRDCGHEVETVVTGGLDVIHRYDRFKPDVVIMDVMMPRFNGITTSHALLSKNPDAKLVLMSGKLAANHPFVTNSGAIRFLSKPLYLSDLKMILDEFAVAEAAT